MCAVFLSYRDFMGRLQEKANGYFVTQTIDTNSPVWKYMLTRDQQLREAVLLSFCSPPPDECARLRYSTSDEWQQLLVWLDTSGLALYFFHRLTQLHRLKWLPEFVQNRLEQNLADNTVRTQALLTDSITIQRRFQEAGLSYALLKGVSVWPSSTPRIEFRSQLDLDYLLHEEDIDAARAILGSLGYHLHAISGRSWEFKTSHIPSMSLDNLYKSHPARSVELHLESSGTGRRRLLPGAITRSIGEFAMPVLPPAELFMGQALHLFKHVCSPSFRCAHLLEFRRSIAWHYDDTLFWNEIQSIVVEDRYKGMALGIVTLLTTCVTGPFAPNSLIAVSVDPLPERLSLWVRTYAHRSVFASFPGTKLYLILQEELQCAGVVPRRSISQALLPRRLPPLIARAQCSEPLSVRFRRMWLQCRYIAIRLRFHLVEGARYAIEVRRWHRILREQSAFAARDLDAHVADGCISNSHR